MTCAPERLVRRIQRRQQSIGPAGSVERPSSQEIAELEARVRRLRSMGGRFNHVTLSSYAAARQAAESRVHVGGDFVATEV